MADSRGMTVHKLLDQVSGFPGPGKPPIKVGARMYPRSSSDDVPAIVKVAAKEIADSPERFDLDLNAADDASLVATAEHLLYAVWPSRRNSDTMHKSAARYVVDWAQQNGIDLWMPEPVKEGPV